MIIKYDSFADLDVTKLRDVLESAFGRKIIDDYFETTEPKYIIVYSENGKYYGAAIITETEKGFNYIDKLAVRKDFKRSGIGKKIWSEIEKQNICWRASNYNTINFWYMKESDGHIKTDDWFVFWMGMDPSKLAEAIEYATNKAETLEPSKKYGLTWEEMENVYAIKKALPYVRELSGNCFVLKMDSGIFADLDSLRSAIEDIAILEQLGINLFVVIETDDGYFEIKREITKVLREEGIGFDIISADKITVREEDKIKVKDRELSDLIDSDQLPLLYIGNGDDVDDSFVPEIAGVLDARKVFYLSNKPVITEGKKILSYMTLEDIDEIIDSDYLEQGDRRKLLGCAKSVRRGVESGHIIPGSIKGSLLLEIFSNKEMGTMVKEYFE